MAYDDDQPSQVDRNSIYNAEVEQPKEGGGGIKSALLGMAKFAVGMAVLGKVSNLSAGALYKNVIKESSVLGAGVKNILGEEALASKNINMGGLFRGVRQTLAETPTAAFGIKSGAGNKVMEVLGDASRDSIEVGKSMRGMYGRWANSSSTTLRAAANVGKNLWHAAPVAAGWYGISRVLGLEDRGNQPAWYNVPGHIGQVAKMTAEFAAYDIGMGGIKKLGGFAKDIVGKHFNAEAAPGLHAFTDRNFAITRNVGESAKAGAFLQTVLRGAAVMDGVREASKTLGNSLMKTLGNSFGRESERRAQQSALFDFRTKGYTNKLKSDTVHSFKNAYRSRMNSLHNYRGDYAHDGLKALNGAIAKDLNRNEDFVAEQSRTGGYEGSFLESQSNIGNTIFEDTTVRQALRNSFNKRTQQQAHSMGVSVFKRKTASVADIMTGADRKQIDNIASYIEQTHDMSGPDGAAAQLKDAFMNMSAGPNIFKTSTGVVDYSMWSPRNMLSNLTHFVNPYFVVGAAGRELPLVKTLGLQHFLAGEGLGLHSIRANEGQRYFDKNRGERGKVATVGDLTKPENTNLGGMVIDGELFVTNQVGLLEKVHGAEKQHMVYSTPYARDSVLYKLNAEAATSGPDLQNLNKLSVEHGKLGFSDRVANFTNRWGLQMPSPINWLAENLGQTFGFGAQKVGVDKTINLLLDPRTTSKSLGGDASSIIGMFGDLGNKALAALTRTLSHPKALDIIARLSKDIGGAAEDRIAALRTALSGTDEEVMEHIRTSSAYENNEQLQYALEHYGQFKRYGLNEQTGASFGFRDVPLTHREEINRVLLNQTLGLQGLPGQDTKYGVENIARRMVNDNEVLKNFSPEEVKHLKNLGTMIDLNRFGYMDGTGRVAADYNNVAAKDAFDIIRDHHKNEIHDLQSQLYHTRQIKKIGVFGFGERRVGESDPFLDNYSRELSNTHRSRMQASPFIMMDEGLGMSQSGLFVNSIIDRVLDMGNHIGLKYGMEDRKPYTFKIPELFNKSVFGKQFVIGGGEGITLGGPLSTMMKRVAQGVGVLAAAQAVDTFTDVNPMFNGTILDHGIYSAAANVYVKASMAFHKVQDLSGITEAAKYLEGLMPSSTSTIPGAVIGGFMKGPLGILPGAVINRFLGANGVLPNFDKSYEEMRDTYSGKELVPVRRNRFWMFSKAPYEGDAPQYFRPHWYPRLKSQYKYTDTLYGSKAEAFLYAPWTGLGYNPIAQVLDKYHYEKKHYWDRPYPVTAPAFEGAFGVGPILAATIGRLPIIGKPIKQMHMDEMSHYYSMNGSNTSKDGELSTSKMPQVSQMEQTLYMGSGGGNNTAENALQGGNPGRMNPYGAMTMLGEQLYNFTELAGLKGYQLESFMGGGLADTRPRLSTASDMWSTRRAYWDMNLGDIFGSTEFFRRFVPRDKKIWQKVNPLRNKMAAWLPSQEGEYFLDFQTGDPYTKIPEGEMRLPGDAYNRLYDVKRTFPGRASSLGDTVMDQVRKMTGLESPNSDDADDIMESGTQLHRLIQESMLRANVGYKAEALVYDAKHDISGHIDLLMYDPYKNGGKRVLEIKTVNAKKFAGIKTPIPHHMAQVNFYLKQMQMDVGTLLYINRDDPTQIRTFDVRYSEQRLRKDLQDLDKARKIAAGLMIKNKGYETGDSYSWLDRLRILSDVAPYSSEYKDAEQIVAIQMRNNQLSERDKEEVAKIKQRRKSVMRKVDLYPTRFRGRVFNPDTTYELWSENTNIKAAAEYSFGERMLGALWERGIQMDTPLNTKLWNYKSPLQHYKSTKIYGTEAAAWNRPYQDFLKPMFTKAMSMDNPVDAAASFGWIGGLGLGGMGNMALPGAVFGGLYGAARTVVGNDNWIPDEVNKKREIVRTFDQLKYEKAMYMYDNTGDEKYKTEADNTLWSISRSGAQVGVGQAMRSLSAFEKPYFLTWMKETNPIERENILAMVPEEVGNLLKTQWGMSYSLPRPSDTQMNVPDSSWEGMLPQVNLDDIEVKTIEQAGLRANDFGLGWYDQQRRMANSQFDLNPISSPSQVITSDDKANHVKVNLMKALNKICRRPLIAVSYNPSGNDMVRVNLNLMRDRFDDIRSALKAR